MEPLNLNDAYKIEVLKFLAGNAGRAWLDVLRSRRPQWPAVTDSAHVFLAAPHEIKGYEQCMDNLLGVAQELTTEPEKRIPNPLLATED